MSLGTVGIVGAGILGRLLALRLRQDGWEVSLFDRSDALGTSSCSHAAAGMLAPYCELEAAETAICRLGRASLELWPRILESIDEEIFFQREGTLVVSHPVDEKELQRLRRKVLAWKGAFQEVGGEALRRLEPELDRRFRQGLYFPDEGQIDNRDVLRALGTALPRLGVHCYFEEEVVEVASRSIRSVRREVTPEWVVDCRGLGAKAEMTDLRGVRGELFLLEAPDVHLTRPVRLVHPRFPLYIAPRGRGRFLVGATVIESDDMSPVSVRSSLELLSAAFSVHPGLAEARIVESVVHCRPAFPSHLPKARYEPGLLRVNGLFRHGFLVSPKLAESCAEFLRNGKIDAEEASLLEEAA